MQQTLNKLQIWADENGFKFSKSKTVCMHFCRSTRHHEDPLLTLNGARIPVVEQTRFLGMVFDRREAHGPIKSTKLHSPASEELKEIALEATFLLKLVYAAVVPQKARN